MNPSSPRMGQQLPLNVLIFYLIPTKLGFFLFIRFSVTARGGEFRHSTRLVLDHSAYSDIQDKLILRKKYFIKLLRKNRKLKIKIPLTFIEHYRRQADTLSYPRFSLHCSCLLFAVMPPRTD